MPFDKTKQKSKGDIPLYPYNTIIEAKVSIIKLFLQIGQLWERGKRECEEDLLNIERNDEVEHHIERNDEIEHHIEKK